MLDQEAIVHQAVIRHQEPTIALEAIVIRNTAAAVEVLGRVLKVAIFCNQVKTMRLVKAASPFVNPRVEHQHR